MSETPTDFAPTPIRYRVWDGYTMHEPGQGDFVILGDGDVWEVAGGEMLRPRPDCIGILSTGLHDADGVEIFDGDKWKRGRHDPITVHVMTFPAILLLREWSPDAGRVVGNAYETPASQSDAT